MPRYFFDLHECGTRIIDPEGRELADMAAVHDVALLEAREMMATEVQRGQLCLSCHIEVLNADGEQVLLLPFKDALKLTGL